MQQDPWAEFRVGGPSRPPQAPQQQPRAPGVIYGQPDPYKQSNEQRAQQDQVMQGESLEIQQERLRLSQEEATRKALKESSGFDATEGERKAGAFLIRALGANKGYEGSGVGPRSYVGEVVHDVAPGLLNQLPAGIGNSPERQVSDSAQDEFIAASLRQDSGAAIPPEELERQRAIYFPAPGDSPEAIEQKRQARLRAIEGLKQSSGRLLDQTLARWQEMQGTAENTDLSAKLGVMIRDGVPIEEINKSLPPNSTPIDPQLYEQWRAFLAQNPDYKDRIAQALIVIGEPPPEGGGGDGGGMGTIATNVQNTLAGLAQGAAGATYDIAADAGDAIEYGLRQGGGAAMDAAGFPNAAEWWRGDFQGSPKASDAIEQMSPTPEGYEASRFASQIAGSMAVPFGPKAAPRPRVPPNMNAITTPAREVVQAGKDAGVRVMTSDVRVPTTFTGKILRATGERIPYAGTGGPRAAQQEERVQAVKDLAKDFGVDVADNYLDDIAADLAATRGGQIAGLVRAKDSVIDGVQGAFQAPRTVQAIDQEVARLKGINEGAFAPVIQSLEAFKANLISGKTLREVEGNRKLLGDMFADPTLAAIRGDGQKAVNAIYAPLRDDMADFIKQGAGKDAYHKWASANKRLSVLAGELDSTAFKSVLGKTETTPEQVSRLLFNKQPSEVRRLYSNLSPEGQAKARAGIIHLAIEKAGGLDNISPDKFANAIAANSKAAGVVFHGADLDRLMGLQRVLQATKQAGVASAAPPTGVQNSQMLGGYIAGASGPVSVPLLGSYGMLARLYESSATRNLLIGLSKTKPGSKAEGQWLERLTKAATAQFEIRAGQVGEAANSNVVSSAAAGNPEQQ